MDDADRGQLAAEQYLKADLTGRSAGIPSGETFLFCEDCAAPIPESRRQASPGCRRCIDCQKKAERACFPR